MSLTQSGMVMGTPYYMSPEQVRGLRDVDERGDVYAFGVILYEMITGTRPFDAETYNQLILKIVTEEPTPLASLQPDVDPRLAAVIARAMARNRDDRYPTVSALASDLEPFAGGVTFRRSSSLPRLTPVASQPEPRISHARTPLTAERPVSRAPSRAGRYVVLALLALAAVGAGAWWGFSTRHGTRTEQPVASDEHIARPAAPTATAVAVPTNPVAPTVQPTGIDAPAASAPEPAPRIAPAPASTRTPSRASHRRATETPAPAAPVPASKPSLPADWDEHLPTTVPLPPRSNSAGKLGREDL
jgi:serine/threonine-protein kinase